MKPFDILVARSSGERAIGKNGEIPWMLKEDLRWFREITTGSVVIMGRRTWDSLPIKPLPNRVSVVLSSCKLSGCHTVSSLDEAMDWVGQQYASLKVFVIGGEGVYREALVSGRCRFIYETMVETTVEGATAFFPEIDETQYALMEDGEWMTENDVRYCRRRWCALKDALNAKFVEKGCEDNKQKDRQ